MREAKLGGVEVARVEPRAAFGKDPRAFRAPRGFIRRFCLRFAHRSALLAVYFPP